MNFRYEDLNKEIFDKVVAFSYSIGLGLGGPGAMIMLIYDMFDPVLFSASRIQTIKTMLEDTL